jgi:heme-degrading monooxygenase HmoA
MYMNRNEAEITLGRADEFEASIEQWSQVQAENAGFAGGTLLQSYANPGRYTLFSRWASREDALAASQRQAFKTFIRDFINSGLTRPTRLTEAFESVFEVDRPDAESTASTAERFIDFSLTTPMVAPSFEAQTRELAELATQHAPGVTSVRLRRSFGNDTRYLVIVITTDRAAARGWLLVPEIRAFTESRSANNLLAGPPSGEIHYVVKRYAGPALAALQTGSATVSAP